MERLVSEGINTWELSPGEAARQLPGLNTDGIGKVAFEPDSGYADPALKVQSLIAKARSNGAEIHINTPATGIESMGEHISKVQTPNGDVQTEVIVNAAGGSGHSFKLAPAIGLCLAEMIIEGRSSTVDISALQAKRFSQNDMLRSTYGGNRA